MWPDVEMKQIPYLNNHNNLTRAPLIINRRAFFLTSYERATLRLCVKADGCEANTQTSVMTAWTK